MFSEQDMLTKLKDMFTCLVVVVDCVWFIGFSLRNNVFPEQDMLNKMKDSGKLKVS